MDRDLLLIRLAIAAVAAVFVVAAPSATSAAPTSWQVEETEERAEEAQESGDAALLITHRHCGPRRAEALASRMAAKKSAIARTRASLRIVRKLPHTTTRWLVHRPNKRAHIRALRKRMRALQAMHEGC